MQGGHHQLLRAQQGGQAAQPPAPCEGLQPVSSHPEPAARVCHRCAAAMLKSCANSSMSSALVGRGESSELALPAGVPRVAMHWATALPSCHRRLASASAAVQQLADSGRHCSDNQPPCGVPSPLDFMAGQQGHTFYALWHQLWCHSSAVIAPGHPRHAMPCTAVLQVAMPGCSG